VLVPLVVPEPLLVAPEPLLVVPEPLLVVPLLVVPLLVVPVLVEPVVPVAVPVPLAVVEPLGLLIEADADAPSRVPVISTLWPTCPFNLSSSLATSR
jgi:signal-induced proliferation-associated 1 like protein 3